MMQNSQGAQSPLEPRSPGDTGVPTEMLQVCFARAGLYACVCVRLHGYDLLSELAMLLTHFLLPLPPMLSMLPVAQGIFFAALHR